MRRSSVRFIVATMIVACAGSCTADREQTRDTASAAGSGQMDAEVEVDSDAAVAEPDEAALEPEPDASDDLIDEPEPDADIDAHVADDAAPDEEDAALGEPVDASVDAEAAAGDASQQLPDAAPQADAAGDAGVESDACAAFCAVKLALECPGKESADDCAETCRLVYGAPCAAQAMAVHACLLQTPQAWICLGGAIVEGEGVCSAEQAALFLCELEHPPDIVGP